MNRKPITPARALERLETLCARSEQCESDLWRKLSLWGIGGGDAARIMSGLRRARFVDDERFARAYVLEKVRVARWGRRKIRLGLVAKRIDRDIIDIALDEEIDEREYAANLMEVLRAKLRTIDDPCSYEGKTRLFRHGVMRGYESSEVVASIKGDELWEGVE
ncbi:MAG: RecX family transcriptional regulator [Pseudoflavonifractor sp.]|nr:RecX family transcriptional regulator [Pseudoflavonifractor sp.]